ncbi:related to lipoamide acyltransferase component of branched-chain alpha-keto acid dehydrogenase complex, mitochondrial precursor [Melanopsichium pennsylvanicum]|uniref:Dihydrolipoamide acetyltransferase component of pyruvate dehydrogenase complex n=2 Tax=Melanopsichium pennsylvanicum TaxID=63383 RepID=A0AAJ4XMT0_9BASI|nr:related to lipoamide acyltransferase component of branched-chain alpha-keto acid dehydrogenase complex, mitochondrial precursor [Melanopsichium pennsylvanicum 4]SNX85038.1 related to lipoamide acyltransferase component of branched-chain alpha-keto acid dehydrogenase complex, mitochondrial precursor [Melanopsichium pennsylvanicum]
MLARTALRRGLRLATASRVQSTQLIKRTYVQSTPTPILYGSSSTTNLRSFATTPRRNATEIKPYLLADVGEGITECEIIKWFVQPGATVQEFDPICEVQSDKASVEITSRYAGRIKRLMHKEGDVAKVGHALCEIEMEVDGSSAGAADASESSKEGEGQSEVEITDVSKGSEFSGVNMEGFVSAEDKHSSGGGSHASNAREVLATPAVRRVSREHNVDLAQVKGTGRDGRITKEDVLNYIQNGSSSSSASASQAASSSISSPSPPSPAAPNAFAAPGTTEIVDLNPVQRAMFKAMTATLHTPHFAYSDEIDVTDLDNVRKLLSKLVPERCISAGDASSSKLTLLPLLVKAMSLALKDHPMFRSTLNSEQKLIRRSSHDISIALTSRVGLLTPCITDVQSKSIYDLSASITRLQTIASSSKGLPPADLKTTGTITLSNVGAVGGGTYTHPLIPPTGQLAIGALGRSRVLPRFASEIPSLNCTDPDKIVRRLIMSVSFTGDHRVVEGADLARLVIRWKQLVENPSLWLGLLA